MTKLLIVPALVWLLTSSVFFAVGEYLSKHWAYHPSLRGVLVVVAAYATSTILWLPALLHRNQLAVMGTAWLVLATIATVIIGLVVFHETLILRQWIGIGAAIGALILLAA